MRSKLISQLTLAVLFLATALPLSAQVAPAGSVGGPPLVAGGGLSIYNMDWKQAPSGKATYMEGVTLWVDWNLYRVPHMPPGLGIEAEGQDIDFGQPSGLSQLHTEAILGGPIYTLRYFRRLYFYGKGLMGLGGIYFPPVGTYSHDTRTIWAAGGGAEYRAWNSMWVRADYEYQGWPHLFHPNKSLDPHGMTIGLVYNFGGMHQRY
jgi:opacity protein-like surface antigen